MILITRMAHARLIFAFKIQAMKRKYILIPFVCVTLLLACNNADKKHEGHGKDGPKTRVDSLMKEIDDLHIKGMSKMGNLTKLQQEARKVADSINRLPAGEKDALISYQKSLDSLLKDLDYAEFAMDKWMPEYYANTDTLADNEEERIKYLNSEKTKAQKITEVILNGIQKADSLLKAKR